MCGEPGRVEPGGGQAILARTVLDEAIRDADVVQFALEPGFGQAFADRAAGAAGDRVLLDRDDEPVRAREAQYSDRELAVSFPGEVGLVLGLDIDMVLQQDPIDWTVRPDAADYMV